MSTFQAIVYGILHGFTEFLPVSPSAHDQAVPFLLGWAAPTGAMSGALSLGALLAVLVYFRHDWASIISCFIGVIVYRKKPMTLDERLPLFLTVTSIPPGLAWYYAHESLERTEWSPWLIAGLLAAFAIPLLMAENFSRKNKGMFDWTWLDALIIGVAEIAAFIPGCGRMSAMLPAAMLRNYNREAAAKYAFFASMPCLAAATFIRLKGVDLRSAQPMTDLSWLSFIMAVVVTMLTGLLAIGGFMKHIQTRAFGHYVAYRFLLAAVICGFAWVKR